SLLHYPLIPTKLSSDRSHRVFTLQSRTVFEFAPMFRPITPLPELVSNAALVRISSVNEPFVPMVTVPLMLLVTLFKVVVAPSATTCACNACAPRERTKTKQKSSRADLQTARVIGYTGLISRSKFPRR